MLCQILERNTKVSTAVEAKILGTCGRDRPRYTLIKLIFTFLKIAKTYEINRVTQDKTIIK